MDEQSEETNKKEKEEFNKEEMENEMKEICKTMLIKHLDGRKYEKD